MFEISGDYSKDLDCLCEAFDKRSVDIRLWPQVFDEMFMDESIFEILDDMKKYYEDFDYFCGWGLPFNGQRTVTVVIKDYDIGYFDPWLRYVIKEES